MHIYEASVLSTLLYWRQWNLVHLHETGTSLELFPSAMPQAHPWRQVARPASSSAASFFAWQRRARNEWLVMNRRGTMGRVQTVVSFPPSFARTSRETSGYEAVARPRHQEWVTVTCWNPSMYSVLSQRRLRWLGHGHNMDDGRISKKVL